MNVQTAKAQFGMPLNTFWAKLVVVKTTFALLNSVNTFTVGVFLPEDGTCFKPINHIWLSVRYSGCYAM